jgi:acyl carrier protein
VLGIDRVGIQDDFFDLGGDSLAASRVVSRVIQQFQLEIPLQTLFDSPTIAAMAAVITAHQGKTLDEQGFSTLLNELDSLSDEEAKRLEGEQRNEKCDE